MDDEDRIILLGLGAFGALSYFALKEIQERNTLDSEEESQLLKKKELAPNEGFSKKEKVKETPIYKDITNLILGKK
ncbi:MAG: hypothetical protein GYA51_15270 [Candidatus Methanofastidiosa archaeon]|jgi:helix-turn-helix protein|nr:hypothetical protein [Candidatus Methanofastidiosa archaeon]